MCPSESAATTPLPDPSEGWPGGRALITRHGFLWRAHYWTDHTHPQGYNYGGYYKFVRAWTHIGAMRLAERFRHQRWEFAVSRWSVKAQSRRGRSAMNAASGSRWIVLGRDKHSDETDGPWWPLFFRDGPVEAQSASLAIADVDARIDGEPDWVAFIAVPADSWTEVPRG